MSATTDVEINLLDPEVFATGRDHAMFAHLRRTDPVHWQEPVPPHDRGIWAITRHADIVAAARDTQTFTSAHGTQIPDQRAEGKLHSIHNMDGARHTALRRALLPHFTPQAINLLNEKVEGIVGESVSAVAGSGTVDFVSEVSAQFPLVVLGELLGVPRSDRPLMLDWTHKLATEDPEYHPTPDAQAEARRQLFDYIHALSDDRRANPRDDLVSAMVATDVDEQPMSQDDIDATFVLIVAAGNETTRHSTSIGVHELLMNAEQRRILVDGEVPVERALEEIVRWATPVMQMRRTATRDVELGGKAIREGDKVVLYFSSANRDEAVFENPMTFDLTRWPNRHIGFGSGPHFCLGAHLARLELSMVLRTLVPYLPTMQLAGEPDRLRSIIIRGIKRMPVRFS